MYLRTLNLGPFLGRLCCCALSLRAMQQQWLPAEILKAKDANQAGPKHAHVFRQNKGEKKTRNKTSEIFFTCGLWKVFRETVLRNVLEKKGRGAWQSSE